MSVHTKFWKKFKARPQSKKTDFKGKHAGYVEGFDGYLYTKNWVDFLIEEIKNNGLTSSQNEPIIRK